MYRATSPENISEALFATSHVLYMLLYEQRVELTGWSPGHSPDAVELDYPVGRADRTIYLVGRIYILPFACLSLHMECAYTTQDKPRHMTLHIGSFERASSSQEVIYFLDQLGDSRNHISLQWPGASVHTISVQTPTLITDTLAYEIQQRLERGERPFTLFSHLLKQGHSPISIAMAMRRTTRAEVIDIEDLSSRLKSIHASDSLLFDMHMWALLRRVRTS